jgi:hypothetical protein
MRITKSINNIIQITLTPNEGVDEVGAIIRALADRNERCQVAKGIRGGPSEELENLRYDAPFVEELLKELTYLE